MMFEVAAEAYGRFMGRYAEPLAEVFADTAGLRDGERAIDVGCGPGALTGVLVDRLGPGAVAAVDPSAPFVAAAAERFPGVDIRLAAAEELPYADDTFDAALAQLVVSFMSDPVAGLREMARVTRPGGTIAACVWDLAGGTSPLSLFWSAVKELDPGATDESEMAGAREGHLVELCVAAGLRDVVGQRLTVEVVSPTFEDWWYPYTLGVGPAGTYVAGISEPRREELRARCRARLRDVPLADGEVAISASAWSVTGVVSGVV